eukprot:gene33679-40743_t
MPTKKEELDELFGSDDEASQGAENSQNNGDKEIKNNQDEEEEEDIFAEVSDDEQPEAKPSSADGEDSNDDLPVKSSSRQKEVQEVFGNSEDEMEVATSPTATTSKSIPSSQLDQILGPNEQVVSKLSTTIPKVDLTLTPADRLDAPLKNVFLRTPNFVKIHPHQFQAEEYDAAAEKEAFNHAPAVIRWKNKNGEMVSNARLVKLSNNTQFLVVGKSIFKVQVSDLEHCYAYEDEEATIARRGPEGQREEEEKVCFESVGRVDARMVVMPLSIDSHAHTLHSLHVSEKFKREKKVQIQDYEKIRVNPEEMLNQLAKREEEAFRRERKFREREREREGLQAGGLSESYVRRPSMSRSYLEDDDFAKGDDDAAPASRAKAKGSKATKGWKPKKYDSEGETEESDEEVEGEMDDFIVDEDEDADGDGDEDDEDEDEDGGDEDEEEEAEDEEDEDEDEGDAMSLGESEDDEAAEGGKNKNKKKKKSKKETKSSAGKKEKKGKAKKAKKPE